MLPMPSQLRRGPSSRPSLVRIACHSHEPATHGPPASKVMHLHDICHRGRGAAAPVADTGGRFWSEPSTRARALFQEVPRRRNFVIPTTSDKGSPLLASGTGSQMAALARRNMKEQR